MPFVFQLSTDAIRNIMFDFIKPAYDRKSALNLDVDFINWTYGVYDSESKFFITCVYANSADGKYILITESGKPFYIIATGCRYIISEIPLELAQYRDIIQDGIALYNKEIYKHRHKMAREKFMESFSAKQKKRLDEITKDMKNRCKPSVHINCLADAKKLFCEENFDYHFICRAFSRDTVSNFKKHIPEVKADSIRSEKYKEILSKIFAYDDLLCDTSYNEISRDFNNLEIIVRQGIDDPYEDMTYQAIKKAYFSGVISAGYVGFIRAYIRSCMQSFPDKVRCLRPLLDFISENMRNEYFSWLDLYRKELERRIYNRIEGFHFICTTDEVREKIFDFLKPEYKARYHGNYKVRSINWVTGVYDKKSGIFLTRIYGFSSRDRETYHSYVIISDNGTIFSVDDEYEYEHDSYCFRISKQYEEYSDKIKEGIRFYEKNHFEYRTNCLDKNKKEELESINSIMDDRCRRNFPINSKEDAKRLFLLEKCNARVIYSIYNKKTVSAFDKFATDDALLLWENEGTNLSTRIEN